VVGANNRTESRPNVLERLTAKFARLGGADQVRSGLMQYGLPLGEPAQRLLGALALAGI
jgi:hypothetical protein